MGRPGTGTVVNDKTALQIKKYFEEARHRTSFVMFPSRKHNESLDRWSKNQTWPHTSILWISLPTTLPRTNMVDIAGAKLSTIFLSNPLQWRITFQSWTRPALMYNLWSNSSREPMKTYILTVLAVNMAVISNTSDNWTLTKQNLVSALFLSAVRCN